MGDTNPFTITFVILALTILISGIGGIIAPSLGFGNAPEIPEFPTWASGLNWTVTLTDWSGIGSGFITLGGVIVYALSYLVYMIASVAFFFTLFGASDTIAYGITGLVAVLFIGSILLFIRGNSGGHSK